jgi:hypothetical protein
MDQSAERSTDVEQRHNAQVEDTVAVLSPTSKERLNKS